MENIYLDVPLLREIQAAILERPELYDQNRFSGSFCGAPCCIAGWAVKLRDGDTRLFQLSRSGGLQMRAAQLLGIPYGDGFFLPSSWEWISLCDRAALWPAPWRQQAHEIGLMLGLGKITRLEASKRMAVLGAERIEAYIAEWGPKPAIEETVVDAVFEEELVAV